MKDIQFRHKTERNGAAYRAWAPQVSLLIL